MAEQGAEELIRAGVPVEAQNFTCPCGETVTVQVPGKPAGVHAPLVLVNEVGEIVRVLNVWVHNSPRCWSKALKALTGGTDTADVTDDEEAPTPIRRGSKAEKTSPVGAPAEGEAHAAAVN